MQSLEGYWWLTLVLLGRSLSVWLMCNLFHFTPSPDDSLLQGWGKCPWAGFSDILQVMNIHFAHKMIAAMSIVNVLWSVCH